MKKKKILFSLKAKDSLKEIFLYIKITQKSPQGAIFVRKGLIETCKTLTNFAGCAKEPWLTNLGENYRSVFKWNYIIIYTISDDEIHILNILHTHQHPEKRQNV